jgi:hypothetical protein
MGASLVGRSHCETPVLIWTSVALSQYMCSVAGVERVPAGWRDHKASGTYSSTFAICASVSWFAGHRWCEGGAATAPRGVIRDWTYELSHCAIHPAGSLGSVGSEGPESGETGGIGGVGAACISINRAYLVSAG